MPSTALAAERDYIHLVRDDAVTAAVEDLDRRLGEPYGSPVLAGTLEKFQNPYRPERASFRLHGIGGDPSLIVDYPAHVDCPEIDRKVRELAEVIRSQLG